MRDNQSSSGIRCEGWKKPERGWRGPEGPGKAACDPALGSGPQGPGHLPAGGGIAETALGQAARSPAAVCTLVTETTPTELPLLKGSWLGPFQSLPSLLGNGVAACFHPALQGGRLRGPHLLKL